MTVFDAERTTDVALPVVELLTAMLWELAQQGRKLSDVPRFLAAGPRTLATAVPMSEEIRSALNAPDAEQQLRMWADAIDSLLRHTLVSEMVERAISQHRPAMVDGADRPTTSWSRPVQPALFVSAAFQRWLRALLDALRRRGATAARVGLDATLADGAPAARFRGPARRGRDFEKKEMANEL